MNAFEKTDLIKKMTLKAGFDQVGIAEARKLPKSDYLETWLKAGHQGDMDWMERYLKQRKDIHQLYPDAKSVLVVAHNYYTSHPHKPGGLKISRYAWGHDYHRIIKKKLKQLLRDIHQAIPPVEGRIYVDTAPIQDKLWAEQAGLGWQGKNTNIISRKMGSWFFIGELVLNIPLIYDEPVSDYCGRCKACIEACPTDALQPYQLAAEKCLSYLTIEYKGEKIPDLWSRNMDHWIFGCDICQEVCPWNRFAKETKEIRYQPGAGNICPDKEEFLNMDDAAFKARFKKTNIFRTGLVRLKRNVRSAINSIRN